jgi:acetyl esterase/lipase
VRAARHVDAFSTPDRIFVANAPDVDVDEVAFRRLCASWAESVGATLAARETAADAIVFNPGANGDSAAASNALPSVGVAFTVGHPRDDSDALEWIMGRGLDGYRWAMRYLRAVGSQRFRVYRYGEDPENVAELRVPEGPGPHPVVVLIHGGGWKAIWGKDLMVPMAVDLARRGFASWNIEFRRLGNGGGWPQTFEDVAAAIDGLADVEDERTLDLDRVGLLGHSSGAHLALWAAARKGARIRARLVVSLAGMVDLVEAERRGLIGGENVTARLLGGSPADVPERYSQASPLERLPLGVPQLLMQGLGDYIPDLVDANRKYFKAASAAGDDVTLLELEGVDHLQPIEPHTTAWADAAQQLEARL